MNRFRYAIPQSRAAIAAAIIMTAMVSILAWMFLSAMHHPLTGLYTGLSGLAFFAFCSAAMLVRYLRNDVVVAVHPTGLFDARWSSEPVAWERIRELVLRRVENEFEIDVYLWQSQERARGGQKPDHTIELAQLEGGAQAVLGAIGNHAVVRIDPAGGIDPAGNRLGAGGT